jgi:hypothetical protein
MRLKQKTKKPPGEGGFAFRIELDFEAALGPVILPIHRLNAGENGTHTEVADRGHDRFSTLLDLDSLKHEVSFSSARTEPSFPQAR